MLRCSLGLRASLKQLSQLNVLNSRLPKRRANRIICTIGPSTQGVSELKSLMQSGMAVARMNFSHGSHAYHEATINNVRTAAAELGLNVAIALDTKGPEIRTGCFVGGSATMQRGATCYVTMDPAYADKGTAERFYVDYPFLVESSSLGQPILIDDGTLTLTVCGREDDQTLQCRILSGDALRNHRGVSLPGRTIQLPAVSEQDRKDLAFGVALGVDFVFASFVRTAAHVDEVRACVSDAAGPSGVAPRIISKIEDAEGLENIDGIIEHSDGIMVARGDMGVNIAEEKVTVAQKMIIAKCNLAGKPVICATQMLESMTRCARPTRAEMCDVVNAVLDGADCVMLSGETAAGQYPRESVEFMARGCCEAQSAANWEDRFLQIQQHTRAHRMTKTQSLCVSAVSVAYEVGAQAILCGPRVSPETVLFLSKLRPGCPIVAPTLSPGTARQFLLSRSVEPVMVQSAPRSTQDLLHLAQAHGYVVSGDPIVVITSPDEQSGGALYLQMLTV